jgi:hypothetical protein
MDVKVRFRFNKLTGEVELFEVDQESGLPNEEHNRGHDKLASELGALLDRHPRILETSTAAPPAGASTVPDEPASEDDVTAETDKRQKDA